MSGTLTMLFAVSNIMKIPAYATHRPADVRRTSRSALRCCRLAVLPNYTGIWLVRRTPTELFFRIVYVLMFLIAIELMRSSITELLRS